eukprot:1194305-Prorocentrum_minimum.AAC.5
MGADIYNNKPRREPRAGVSPMHVSDSNVFFVAAPRSARHSKHTPFEPRSNLSLRKRALLRQSGLPRYPGRGAIRCQLCTKHVSRIVMQSSLIVPLHCNDVPIMLRGEMRMRPSRNRATDVTGWWQAWSLPMELPGRPPEHARWSPVIFTDDYQLAGDMWGLVSRKAP